MLVKMDNNSILNSVEPPPPLHPFPCVDEVVRMNVDEKVEAQREHQHQRQEREREEDFEEEKKVEDSVKEEGEETKAENK